MASIIKGICELVHGLSIPCLIGGATLWTAGLLMAGSYVSAVCVVVIAGGLLLQLVD